MEKSVKITLIIVIGVLILSSIITGTIIYLFSQNKGKPGEGQSTINVEGQYKIKVNPDLVIVYFRAETNGTTPKEAKDKNTEIVNKTINDLKKINISEEKIQTENFITYPEYDWVEGKQKLIGYKAVHLFKVIIDTAEIEKIIYVIDIGADAGVMISNINFELSIDKQNYYKAEALKMASQDAKAKAEAIASGVGKKIGKIISISGVSFDYYSWPIYISRGLSPIEEVQEAKKVIANIKPSEREVKASVYVVYEIID